MMGRPPAGYRNPKRFGQATQSFYVMVKGVDTHFERARKAGAASSKSRPPLSTDIDGTGRRILRATNGASPRRFGARR